MEDHQYLRNLREEYKSQTKLFRDITSDLQKIKATCYSTNLRK